MHDRITRLGLPALAIASLLSCNKSPETTPTTPPTTTETAPSESEGSGEAEAHEAPAAWNDDLTDPQKSAFMKAHVVPAMDTVFKGYDAEHYAEFGCKTCHGPTLDDPDEFLPHLTVKDGQLVEMTTHPEVSKFMGEQVLPKMIEVMGVQPYDPATGEGFGCNGCHEIDMQ